MNEGVHEREVIGMIRFLKQLGFTVTVVASKIPISHPIEDEVEVNWADWRRLPLMETFTKLRGIRRVLRRILPVQEFDVAITDTISANVLISVMKMNGSSFPFLFDERSPPVYNHLAGRLQWLITNQRWKNCAPKAAACIVQSEAHADFIRKRYRLSNHDFIIYRNSVDVEAFTPSKKENKAIAVYTGTLRKERGIIDLINAGRIVNQSANKMKILIFGKGPMASWVAKQAASEDWLEYNGWVEDDVLKETLGKASIGIIPHPDMLGWRICSPLKMLEYAASGMVVIARNLPSHREVGAHDWLSLVDADDGPEKLAEGFIQLLKRDDLVQAGEKARLYAEQEMTFEARAEELVEHLRAYL